MHTYIYQVDLSLCKEGKRTRKKEEEILVGEEKLFRLVVVPHCICV